VTHVFEFDVERGSSPAELTSSVGSGVTVKPTPASA